MVLCSGEDLVVTTLADVHYIYNSLTAQPLHHRFDKESHVYLYENASKRQTRIEITNQTGTRNKDAVDGYLDEICVQYSFKHPTLISFTIGQAEGQEWQLPSFDLRNEKKSLFKLHYVDIYTWTNEGAIQLLNAIRRLLPQEHVTILYEPITIPSHYHFQQRGSAVQGLEASTSNDPLMLYHQKQIKNSVHSISGPPISATPNVHQFTSHTPLPYDPAAPPAPEKLTYREKTPPIDDGGINPLKAIISSDFDISSEDMPETVHQNHVINMPGPPPITSACHTSNVKCILSPPSEALNPVMTSYSNLSPLSTIYNHQSLPPQVKSNHSNVPVTQYAIYPNSSGAPRTMNTPSFYSPESSTPLMAPIEKSKYQYTSDKTNLYPTNAAEYSSNHLVNNKIMESEAIPKSSKPIKVNRFEEHAARLERGVGSLLKKLEKKIG
ncbi:hypothetical protein OnM2_007005 [Erysiphe neolycopersici]|uniref:Uncharacterized protein n=1 Tax=Erysiphe neolycopersici TaxID=212602 RepID=A0A420I759_9PEZI|nr:hypothetical protein OnM2_007005 [Erysiphe neolycopersici]